MYLTSRSSRSTRCTHPNVRALVLVTILASGYVSNDRDLVETWWWLKSFVGEYVRSRKEICVWKLRCSVKDKVQAAVSRAVNVCDLGKRREYPGSGCWRYGTPDKLVDSYKL